MTQRSSSRLARLSLAIALSFGAAACGDASDSEGSEGSDGSLSRETALSFEGVYQLTRYTQNEAGCDGEGASVLEAVGETWFVLVAQVALGQETLRLVSCADAADCADTVDQIRNHGSYGFDFSATLTSEGSSDELAGFSASSGFEEDGMCIEREYVDHVLMRNGKAVRLESRTKVLADKPTDGGCSVQPSESREEAESAACTGFAALEGTKVSGL